MVLLSCAVYVAQHPAVRNDPALAGFAHDSGKHPGPPAERSPAFRVAVAWATPEAVLVIRADGPDGDDDSGRVLYDSDNGVRSDGDLVQFLLPDR